MTEPTRTKKQVMIWLRHDQVEWLDELRRRTNDMPARSEAIRRVVDDAMKRNISIQAKDPNS